MKKVVFLDRDGVLNVSNVVGGVPKPPSQVDEVQIIEGVSEALDLLLSNEYLPIVVSNQPDVARGLVTK
jgi:histidinol phosphatase-like enzyme